MGEVFRRSIRLPRNRLLPSEVQVALGVWLSFTMSIGMTSNFCEDVKIINQSDNDIAVSLWAISQTHNHLELPYTPIIGQTLSLHGWSTARLIAQLPATRAVITRQLLESISGDLVMVVVKKF